jgi:transcriptional regulator with XRE-family HTH domain
MNYAHEMPRLRMYRRQWQLTLRELAELLGFRSSAHVSRLEQGKRTPSLETALACTAIFGVTLEELFPEFVRRASARIQVRATRFRKGHEKRSTPSNKRKCELVDDVLDRLGAEPKTIEA